MITFPYTLIRTDKLRTLKSDHYYMVKYRGSYIEALAKIRKLKEAK